MFCKGELSHNAVEATKDIYCEKGERAIDQMVQEISRRLQECRLLGEV